MDGNLEYVEGYKGFRVGVKAKRENFHNLFLKARNEAKVILFNELLIIYN